VRSNAEDLPNDSRLGAAIRVTREVGAEFSTLCAKWNLSRLRVEQRAGGASPELSGLHERPATPASPNAALQRVCTSSPADFRP
jgi:hypothetical protein